MLRSVVQGRDSLSGFRDLLEILADFIPPLTLSLQYSLLLGHIYNHIDLDPFKDKGNITIVEQ